MSLALIAIKMLRKLPHSRGVDRHLDDCAALEILHGAFPMQHPSLRITQVIGAISLPDLQPSLADMEPQTFPFGVISNQIVRGGEAIKTTNPRFTNDNVEKTMS
jgi:hypothetical protein